MKENSPPLQRWGWLAGREHIHPEVQAEILRRRKEALAHPERLEPWEGTTERVRHRLHEIRHQKKGTQLWP